MVFEDNFVYPFPGVMYDPVLKIRVHISNLRESSERDVPLAIYYDPEIEADHLKVPVSDETKAFWRSRPQDRHKADDNSIRWPFMSDREKKIDGQPCRWGKVDDKIRLKVFTKGETFIDVEKRIKSLSIPKISDDPLSLLIYVYKKYINLSALRDEHYNEKLCPDAKSVDICLNADAFLNAFELSPTDYAEVEPGWYCLASKELVR